MKIALAGALSLALLSGCAIEALTNTSAPKVRPVDVIPARESGWPYPLNVPDTNDHWL